MSYGYITPGSPCLNCPKRHPACHGTCEPYKVWRAKADSEIAAARSEQHIRNGFRELRENGMRRAGKKVWKK